MAAASRKRLGGVYLKGWTNNYLLICLGYLTGLQPLVELASGTSSFGPMKEWNNWYHYLLGALVPRSHEAFVSYLLESLLTGFMAIYPNGIYREPYEGMCWNGTDIAIGKVLRKSNNNPNHVWAWWDASGDFAASMFFCLKYLPESSVEPWLRSVFDIPSPHCRAAALNVVRSYFNQNRFLEWLECISTVPYLESELAEIPSTFEALYVRHASR
eukprot:gene37082-45745_t